MYIVCMGHIIADRDVDCFHVDEEVEVKLCVQNSMVYDSLHGDDLNDVSAYVIFSFDDGDDVVNYQFVARTGVEDAEVVHTEIQCNICSSTQLPQFRCGRNVQYTLSYEETTICEGCLDSFLEIRDELLEEFSGDIVSEGL